MNPGRTLEVSGLSAGYVPGVDILSAVSLVAAENAVTLVIGPNGAGKSMLLRAIFGILKPSAGRVRFRGKDVTRANSSALKAAGVSYVTQDLNSFPLLTVEENLLMGAWVFRRDRRRVSRQGRMLSVARELMTQPSLLLIDEPTVGLAPNLVAQVYSLLSAAKTATGAAILLVEQNVEEALPLADYLYLLNLGQVKAEGPGRDFDHSRVRALVQECLLG